MAELLIATGIFMLTAAGIIFSYIMCMELAEIAKNSSLAIHSARNQIELIKSTQFSLIHSAYNGANFSHAELKGIGVTYIDNTSMNMVKVKTVFCWRQPNGRIIGEDKNLNGQLDTGEDTNGNNQVDSLVSLETDIYDK